MKYTNFPKLIAHCDWGGKCSKRWMATARWDDSRNKYVVGVTKLVGDTSLFLLRLRHSVETDDRILCGFDFPIGLPKNYADKVGVNKFRDIRPDLGVGKWERFYDKCRVSEEISLERPFYPVACKKKGDVTQNDLFTGLGLTASDLLRKCERKTDYRDPASPLFWTLGGKSVGTAAITGWRDLIAPAIRSKEHSVGIWPFDGLLEPILNAKKTIFVETYPGDAYSHLHFPKKWKGKNNNSTRKKRASDLLDWVKKERAHCNPRLITEIKEGFGTGVDGEDRFDAVVGLFSMVDVVLGHRNEGVPDDSSVKEVEGWIFGQKSPAEST